MKKRAMKKWIPKNTVYCYDSLVPKDDGSFAVSYVGHCKWRKRRKHSVPEDGIEYEIYCTYLGKFDSELDCGLLWDACKECGEHYDNKAYYNRYYKWRYKHRDKIRKMEEKWHERKCKEED